MANFIDILKKQGGLNLIRTYWNAGVLGYAVFQMLILGRDRKSLEILRNGVTLKIYRKLRKRYMPIMKALDTPASVETGPSKKSSKVWVCWMQGIENAPALVQKCYASLKRNLNGKEIVLITSENVRKYTDFPAWIWEKYEKGLITHTHFSDLLRIELLCRHGGTWIDATVFCSGPNIPDYMLDSDLFMFQNLKPGADGSTLNISSWFITACANNKVLLAVRKLLWNYWKRENKLIDYFLIHHFMIMALDYYSDETKKIIQFPNSLPHVLLLMLFESFNQEKWDAVTAACPFHKLAYKRSKEEMEKDGTYYKYIMEE